MPLSAAFDRLVDTTPGNYFRDAAGVVRFFTAASVGSTHDDAAKIALAASPVAALIVDDIRVRAGVQNRVVVHTNKLSSGGLAIPALTSVQATDAASTVVGTVAGQQLADAVAAFGRPIQQTFGTPALRTAYTVTALDLSQQRLFRQADNNSLWTPTGTVAAPVWNQVGGATTTEVVNQAAAAVQQAGVINSYATTAGIGAAPTAAVGLQYKTFARDTNILRSFVANEGGTAWVEVETDSFTVFRPWTASTAVRLNEIRTMVVGGVTVAMRSTSARTTTATLDAAELANWSYVSQNLRQNFAVGQLVIPGFQSIRDRHVRELELKTEVLQESAKLTAHSWRSSCVAADSSVARALKAIEKGDIEKAKKLLGDARDNCGVLIEMLEDAHKKASNSVKYEAIMISDLIRQCFDAASTTVEGVEHVWATSGVSYTIHQDCELMVLKTDIIVAVREIVGNAFKYGRPPIAISVTSEGGTAIIDITDSGDGVAPEDVGRLFKKGSRLSSTVSGTGLGLYHVLQVMLQHKGNAECLGKTFRLTLPIV